MERVLITGGFGFLGRHLIEELARSSPQLSIVAADLHEEPRVRRPAVTYLGGIDIVQPDSIARAVRGCDAVIHLAGLVSFWSGDRDRLFQVNQLGTRNVAAACAQASVKRLVHVSSVAAIGYDGREDALASESLDFDWSSAAGKHYMLSKRASEAELRIAGAAGIAVVTACPGLMYGPGDRTNVALYRAVHSRRMPVVPPGGTNVVDVRDVAAGLRALLLSDARDERFILGGHNVRFTEIVRTIARAFRTELAPARLPLKSHSPAALAARLLEALSPRKPALTGDHVDSSFRFRYFTSQKAATRLGWHARIPLTRTIADAAHELLESGVLAAGGRK